MSLEYIDHSLISSKDVEIKLILNVDCKIYNTVERSIIEKITEEQLDESARAIKAEYRHIFCATGRYILENC